MYDSLPVWEVFLCFKISIIGKIMSERLKIAIPNGQLEEGVLGVARGMGLEFQEPGREYSLPGAHLFLLRRILCDAGCSIPRGGADYRVCRCNNGVVPLCGYDAKV